MIIRLMPLFVFSLLVSLATNAQQGFHVQGEISGFKGDFVYIGYRLGDQTYVKDTVPVNDQKFDYHGSEKLGRGIYLLILPPSMNYLEFLMADDQNFSMSTQVGKEIGEMKFSGSTENEVYYDYLKFASDKSSQIDKLEEENALLPNTTNSYQRNVQEIYKIKNEVFEYRRTLYEQHPELMITKLMKASEDPEIPQHLMDSDDEKDQVYYLRDHFFDNVDFTEPAILKLPLFTNRVNRYYDQLTVQHPDSLIASVEKVLSLASVDSVGYKIVMIETVNKYASSQMTAAENVYVHLVENYYDKGKTPWADPETVGKMSAQAKKLKPTLLTSKVPSFEVTANNGKKVTPKKMKSQFTILFLWNAEDEGQRDYLVSLVNMLNGREDDEVELITIALKGDPVEWEKFIEFKQSGGYAKTKNCLASGQRDHFMETFNYSLSRARVFLLDDNQKIIAKDLSIEDLDRHIGNILYGPEN